MGSWKVLIWKWTTACWVLGKGSSFGGRPQWVAFLNSKGWYKYSWRGMCFLKLHHKPCFVPISCKPSPTTSPQSRCTVLSYFCMEKTTAARGQNHCVLQCFGERQNGPKLILLGLEECKTTKPLNKVYQNKCVRQNQASTSEPCCLRSKSCVFFMRQGFSHNLRLICSTLILCQGLLDKDVLCRVSIPHPSLLLINR